MLIRMLPSYYQHVCQYKNSLVTKFLGVHCVKPIGGQKVRTFKSKFCTKLLIFACHNVMNTCIAMGKTDPVYCNGQCILFGVSDS